MKKQIFTLKLHEVEFCSAKMQLSQKYKQVAVISTGSLYDANDLKQTQKEL